MARKTLKDAKFPLGAEVWVQGRLAHVVGRAVMTSNKIVYTLQLEDYVLDGEIVGSFREEFVAEESELLGGNESQPERYEYPTVSTVEEIDALPFGTTILNVRFTVTNGHRPWSKVDLRWGDGTPNPKQWASYNAKYRDAEMLISRRGGHQTYWILFQPETEPQETPIELQQLED